MEHKANDSILPREPSAGFQPRIRRKDGWTPERIRTFIHTLAACGVAAKAARAAGMSVQGAYAFRNSANGWAFDIAWSAALMIAEQRRRPAAFRSRAVDGYIKPIVRKGRLWGEIHRFDNRHSMATLTRLDGILGMSSGASDAADMLVLDRILAGESYENLCAELAPDRANAIPVVPEGSAGHQWQV